MIISQMLNYVQTTKHTSVNKRVKYHGCRDMIGRLFARTDDVILKIITKPYKIITY